MTCQDPRGVETSQVEKVRVWTAAFALRGKSVSWYKSRNYMGHAAKEHLPPLTSFLRSLQTHTVSFALSFAYCCSEHYNSTATILQTNLRVAKCSSSLQLDAKSIPWPGKLLRKRIKQEFSKRFPLTCSSIAATTHRCMQNNPGASIVAAAYKAMRALILNLRTELKQLRVTVGQLNC